LIGSIPTEIRNLSNLINLDVRSNVDLTGRIEGFRCDALIYTGGTKVTVCGCASKTSASTVWPPPDTTDECLATGPAPTLQKRVLAFSLVIGSYSYTCNVDGNGNPFQDCLNCQAKICHPNYMGTNTTLFSECKRGVDEISKALSTYWQAVRRECGQWAWNGFTGNVASSNCASANSKLAQNAYYIGSDGSRTYVSSSLTDSVNANLWGNTKLNG